MKTFARTLLLSVSALAMASAASAAVTNYTAGSTSAAPIVLTDNTTQLQVTTGSATQSGVISENGGSFRLEKIGAGTLSLSGANTYSGGTTITAGTLQIGNGGTSGSLGTGAVSNGSALSFNRSDTVTVANAISGAGSVTQAGGASSITILTGNNSWTGATAVSGGVLQVGGGGTTGRLGNTSTVTLSNNALLAFNRSDATTIANAITGNGRVNIAGTSPVTLTGTNTYTGATIVSTGSTLILGSGTSGSVAGPITANGTVTFNRTDTVTTASSISGAGTVNFASGTTIYTGTAINTGVTTIASGATLQLGNGGTAGAFNGSGGIVNDGAFIFNRAGGAGSTISSVISGAGSFRVQSGSISLMADNTYTGGTTIDAGATLNIPTGTAVGSVVGAIVNNGIFNLNHTGASVTYGGVISGTGNVIFAGNNTLTAAQTYTGVTSQNSNTLILSGLGSIARTSSLELSGFRNAGFDISAISATGTSIGSLASCGNDRGVTCSSGDTTSLPGSTVTLGAKTLTLTNAVGNFLGAINGTGGLTIAAGTEILSGLNTYSGTTSISSGATLQIGNGSTLGSLGTGAVTVNGTLIFNRSDNISVANAIGGTGTVKLQGGTTTLTGTLAPGSVAGSVGTLNVAGNLAMTNTSVLNADVATSGADKLAVTGTAAIAGTLNASFASGNYSNGQYTLVSSTGALTGTFGTFNVIGAPANFSSALSYGPNAVSLVLSTALSANATTNVNGGTVAVASNTAITGLASSGSGGSLALSSGVTLTDNQNSNTTFSGTITGAGAFAKGGTGSLILNGVNTYTGGTAVGGGVLEIGDINNKGASILGPVNVTSGGTLSGHGTINGSVAIGAGGNFQPGGTIGTISVGSATFASGSTYTVETNAAGQGNLTVASGAITINPGATLVATEDDPLSSYGRTTSYTVLQAGGGISGTFSSVTSATAGFLPTVTYGANSTTLVLLRADMFQALGTTLNQANVARAVVASGGSALTGALAVQNDATVVQSLGQLSGEIHTSLRSAAIEDSRIIRDTVIDHLGRISDGIMVWGAGFGGYGSISTDGNASGLHHDTAGFIAGADMPVGDGFRLGLAGAYTSNNTSVTGKTSTASGNSGHVVAYGGWTDGKMDLKLGGDFGWGNTQVARTVAAFAQTNTDRQGQRLSQVFGDAGYKFETSWAMVEPYVGMARISATTGSFNEIGGTTALSGGARTDTQTYGTLGLRASLAPMTVSDSIGSITPHVDMGWQHAFKTLPPGQVVNIASVSQSFTVLGAPLASDAAAVRAGFDLTITPEAVLSLDYDGSFANRVQNNAVRGSLAWRF